FNALALDEIVTSRLRVSMLNTSESTGILEWRVYGTLADDDSDPTPEPEPDPSDLTYTVTAVHDDLDNKDLYDMANELGALGYSENVADTDVTTGELAGYLQQPTTTLYHTGHGSEGFVATADGALSTQDLIPNKINVQNTIFATCLTVEDRTWRDTLGASAETLAGYTDVSYDITDEVVVSDFGDYLRNGRSYPEAWYLSNNNIGALADRWLVYFRSGDEIVEYSASSGNIPKSSVSALQTADKAGKLKVAEHLLNDHTDYSHAFGRVRMFPAAKTGSLEPAIFRKLNRTVMSRGDAVNRCKSHLSTLGELTTDMFLSKSYPIRSRRMDNAPWNDVGWVIRHTMTADDGLQIRGNSSEPNKSTVVTGSDTVVAMTKFWPRIVVEKAVVTHEGLLTPSQALREAKEAISRRIKKGPLVIIDVEPLYGISKPAFEAQVLVPSYGFATTDNFVVVVSAVTGELLP
ncbi:MAG: hypothetical protein PVJ19_23085, partial [Desulfobacteraceae bacterium]